MGQSGFLGVLISRIDMTLFRNVLSNGSSAAVVDPVGTLVQLAASGPISLDATTLHSATTDIPGSLQNANEVIVWGRFHGDLDIVLAQSTTGGVYTTTVRNAAVIAITLAVMALVGARFLDRSLNAQRVAVKALHSAAVHDPLTGIPNRALFGDRLQYAVATTKRTGRPFSLVYIDLDDFKRVNDTLGHKAGDAYLCAIADRLVGVLRATDIVARLGGDEFALILPDTDQTGSVTAIEKCARAMDGDFRLEDRTVRCLGLSFGVATYSGGQDDAAALMKTADAAMYQDKQSHKQRR
jgi:diguanylate cyclase (GGDEF)-like protein